MVKDYDSAPSLTTSNKESSESRIEDQGAKSPPENSEQPSTPLNLSDSESKFILKARKKLRLRDPEGVYKFKGNAIPYYQSFIHLISLLFSVNLIVFLFAAFVSSELEHLDGVGNTSDITVVDKIFLITLVALTVFKLKKLVSVKVTNYSVRYKLAMVANAFNRIAINLVKFAIYFFAFALFIICVDRPNETISGAFDRLENGAIAESLALFSWIVTTLIFVKAFKRFGKE